MSISRYLIPWVSAGLLLLVTSVSRAQTLHIAHCLQTCPESASAGDLVVRHLYAASMDAQTDLAQWVAYRVLGGTVGVASLLPRYWLPDELLPIGLEISSETGAPRFSQPDLSDQPDRSYRVNEIIFATEDRGRLAPMTSFASTPYWEELNRLSNMAPIPNDLRRGSWARLETAVNELAMRVGELYVIAGPIFTAQSPTANAPAAYFKLVATERDYAAFIFPAELPIHAHYCDQVSSLAQIEADTGLILFPDKQVSGTTRLSEALAC